jgi:hypothetical protein
MEWSSEQAHARRFFFLFSLLTCAIDARPTRHFTSYSPVALFFVYHTSFHCGHESAEKHPNLKVLHMELNKRGAMKVSD